MKKFLRSLALIATMFVATTAMAQNPTLYYTGNFTDPSWSATGALELNANADGEYIIEFPNRVDNFEFKVSTVKADWDNGFNANALGLNNKQIDATATYTLEKGNGNNISTTKGTGKAIIKKDGDNYTLRLEGTFELYDGNKPLTDVNLRGDLNGWGTTPMALQNETRDSEGYYNYVAVVPNFKKGSFKVADNGWTSACNYGAGADANVTLGKTVEAFSGSQTNFNLTADLTDVKVTFRFNPDQEAALLTIVENTEEIPAPENMYLIGEVGDQVWNPTQGILMDNEGDGFFTLKGANIKGYFALTSALGANEEDWNGMNSGRVGPADKDRVANLDENVVDGSGDTSWQIFEEGYYDVYYSFYDKILTLEEGEAPVVPVPAATLKVDGTEATATENTVTITVNYTAENLVEGREVEADIMLGSSDRRQLVKGADGKATATFEGLDAGTEYQYMGYVYVTVDGEQQYETRTMIQGTVTTLAAEEPAPEYALYEKWTVEKANTTTANTDARFGTALDGKIYYFDKAQKAVMVLDGKSDTPAVYRSVENVGTGVGTAISVDEAGNVLISTGWFDAVCGTNFHILPADGSDAIDLTITLPDDIAVGRVDQLGRIAGDMLSEEGAFVFLPENGASELVLLQIKEGKQVTNGLSYYTTENSGVTINTSTVVQPTATFEEMVDMGDEAVNAWAARNRSSKYITMVIDGEATKLAMPAEANTQEGFDIFYLGDKLYQVHPAKLSSGQNYSGEYVIADEEGNTIEKIEVAPGNGSQNFGSIVARKVAEHSVELYFYYASPAGISAAKYIYGVDIEEPVEPTPEPALTLGEITAETTDTTAEVTVNYTAENMPEGAKVVATIGLNQAPRTSFENVEGEDGKIVVTFEGLEAETEYEFFVTIQAKDADDATIEGTYKQVYDKFTTAEAVVLPTSDKAHYAYNLSAEPNENFVYTINFSSTGDAKTAYLVLTDAATGETKEVEIGSVNKGENTFTYDASELDGTSKYNWAIRLHNYAIEEDVVNGPVAVGGNRAALATFTDPEYPEVLGYTVIGRTKNGGIDVYDPEGNKVNEDPLYANCEALGNTNNSSPMDATTRGTEAYLASWGDASYGIVAFDLAKYLNDEDATPYAVLEGTKEANGLIKNEAGEFVGSGTPCVGVWGQGEETTLIFFNEDGEGFDNKLVQNVIGNGKTTTNAMQIIGDGYLAQLQNTNIGLAITKKGFFASQCRALGSEWTTAGLHYFARNDEGSFDHVWEVAEAAVGDNSGKNDPLPSALAGVAVNRDETLVVVPGYEAFYMFDLAWDEDGKPVISNRKDIANPYGRVDTRTNVRFDQGGNLHVVQQAKGYYTITLANEEAKATTAAPSESFIASFDAVGNIAVEGNEADAVYYNINGVRVDGQNMVPGVYVKVVGKTATKVIVK